MLDLAGSGGKAAEASSGEFGRKALGRAGQDEATCGDTGMSHSRGALSSECGCFTLSNLIQKTPLWPPIHQALLVFLTWQHWEQVSQTRAMD